jgi:hypothetical protein
MPTATSFLCSNIGGVFLPMAQGSVKMARMIRSKGKRLRQYQAIIEPKKPKPSAKPKGREAFKKLYEVCEGMRTTGGMYRALAIPESNRIYHPPAVPERPRKIKLNKNRFGRNPFSGLQGVGMPGNEETDPGRR